MAEIISLSKARKAKARAGKEALAAENRVKFGRTKAEKALAEAEKALAEAEKALADKRTDAHKRGEDE